MLLAARGGSRPAEKHFQVAIEGGDTDALNNLGALVELKASNRLWSTCLQSQIRQDRYLRGRRTVQATPAMVLSPGCLGGAGRDRCEWHASGTAGENDLALGAPLAHALPLG
jgi:hypothetical protein